VLGFAREHLCSAANPFGKRFAYREPKASATFADIYVTQFHAGVRKK
jgi:hypothetical protein